MDSPQPQFFGQGKLPRPMCPRLSTTGSFSCSCGFTFDNRYSMTVHQDEHKLITTHVRPSLSLRNLERPLLFPRPSSSQLRLGLTSFPCSSCEKIFTTQQGLRQHEGKKHPLKRNKDKCLLCGQFFADKYKVKIHVEQIHKRTQRVRCEICRETLYSKYVYEKHLLTCRERIKLRDAFCKQ